MEGDGREPTPGSPAQVDHARIAVLGDVLRFVLGLIFVVLGAALLAVGVFSGATGSQLTWDTDNVPWILNVFLGLVGLTLAGYVLGSMHTAYPRRETTPTKTTSH